MSSKNIVLRKTFPRVIKTEDKRRGLVRYIVDTRKNGKGERLFFEREKDAVARAKELAQELPVDRDSITLSSELRAMAHKCANQLAGFSVAGRSKCTTSGRNERLESAPLLVRENSSI